MDSGRRGQPPDASPDLPSTAPPSTPKASPLLPDLVHSDLIKDTGEDGAPAAEGWRWAVRFREGQGNWISGRLHHSPASRWTVLLYLDNDVRAGDYIDIDGQMKVGTLLRIDIFDVVVDLRMQMVCGRGSFDRDS